MSVDNIARIAEGLGVEPWTLLRAVEKAVRDSSRAAFCNYLPDLEKPLRRDAKSAPHIPPAHRAWPGNAER